MLRPLAALLCAVTAAAPATAFAETVTTTSTTTTTTPNGQVTVARSVSTAPAPDGDSAVKTVGPFVAAVVALGIAFSGAVAKRLRQPRLRLDHDPMDKAHDDRIVVFPNTGDERRLWRLRARNVERRFGSRRTAEDVEISVTRLQPHDGEAVTPITGRALRWTLEESPKAVIPSGVGRYCDLAVWSRADGERALVPLLPTASNEWRYELMPGRTYELDLVITAKDVRAVHYTATITRRAKAPWPVTVERLEPARRGRRS